MLIKKTTCGVILGNTSNAKTSNTSKKDHLRGVILGNVTNEKLKEGHAAEIAKLSHCDNRPPLRAWGVIGLARGLDYYNVIIYLNHVHVHLTKNRL